MMALRDYRYMPIFAALAMLCLCGCWKNSLNNQSQSSLSITLSKLSDSSENQLDIVYNDSPSEIRMKELGMVDIAEIDSTIQVKLMYATADNFMHKVLYSDIRKAYILPIVSDKLKRAQAQLKVLHPDWSIIVYDAARPLSVQREMWAEAQKSGFTRYVGNPEKRNSLHNYGAAVDVSLVNKNGTAIDMGTPVDWFGEEAHINAEDQLVSEGKISQEQLENRRLLRKIMTDNGMLTIRSEWWHFEVMRASQAKRELKILE